MGYRPVVYKQYEVEVDDKILEYLERGEKFSFFDNMFNYLNKLRKEYDVDSHIDEYSEDSKTYIDCKNLITIDINNMSNIFTEKEKEMTQYLIDIAKNAKYVQDGCNLIITWG